MGRPAVAGTDDSTPWPSRARRWSGSASHPAGVTDTISGYKYSPDPVKVQVGGAITWINQDADPHTATSDTGANPAFDTGIKRRNRSAAIAK